MHFFLVQGYQDYILGKAEGYEISRQVFMDLLGLKPKHCRAVRFGVVLFQRLLRVEVPEFHSPRERTALLASEAHNLTAAHKQPLSVQVLVAAFRFQV